MKVRKQIEISKYNGAFDVPYSQVSPTCKLDIYLPKGSGPFPVIMSIHGGAFKKCDKRDEEMILDMLHGLDRGYAVVGVNYRLSGEAQFPKPVQDIKQAIRFIKEQANVYHLDKNKIIAWGGSAGGYFTLMAGLIAQCELFDDENSNDTDAKIQGLVAWFPPVNFINMDTQLQQSGLLHKSPDHLAEDSPESLFMGAPITKHLELVQQANPETYLHKDVCPMLIQHGRCDRVVPYQQSQEFVEKAEKISKNPVLYEILENADHGDLQFSTKENIDRVFQFIDSIVK